MELFIPSLAFLLAAVAVCYFVLPDLAPAFMIGSSILVLVAALYVHWSKFGVMEYERSTWQYKLRQYSAYIMIVAILLGAYGFYAMNNGSFGESSYASPSVGAFVAPAMGGGGFGTITSTAHSRIRELMRRGRISLE